VEKKPEATITVTFEAPESLVEDLETRALREDRSRSAVIRQLLLRALAANEKTA
jgi:metal-responsive CopG/Arc/MetJ family transcriptional regulator